MSVHGLCDRDEVHEAHVFEMDVLGEWHCPGQHSLCRNCDDRKCMGCVLREWGHDCADDCPDCCSTASALNLDDSRHDANVVPCDDDAEMLRAWKAGELKVAGCDVCGVAGVADSETCYTERPSGLVVWIVAALAIAALILVCVL